MTLPHFPNTSKPVAADLVERRKETARRAFHRINAPNYDTAVDTNDSRRGNKRRPSGLAKESGARGPEAFQASGFLEHFARLAAKLLKSGLLAIPVVGQALFLIDQFVKQLTGTSPLEELFGALAKLISSGVEGALFARLMRSIPSWVPVGRRGYRAEFRYEEDGAPRTTDKEEEREIEGFLTGSYALQNDVVFTQWSHFRHWAFHVLPTPGYQYLIGRGNVPDPAENSFIERIDTDINAPLFERALRIYGQSRPGFDPDLGAIECLIDVGAISKPPGDGGFHGVHFASQWPYWPMAGDYFWAAGRWSYDCMRATQSDKTEIYPTQINPIKAFAAARFEGVKFAENAASVAATRFFFFATSEGGFRDFHTVPGRKGPPGQPHITLRDRDYEFIVDLPPHELGRSPFPIGATINFASNTIVIRPRLLIQIRAAPFDVGGRVPNFAEGLKAVGIEPRIEILRPSDPNQRPQQAKVTIPLSKLPAPSDAQAKEMVGLDISFGWHDPTGEEVKEMVEIRASIHFPKFFSQSGPVRMATCINGRWSILAEEVKEEKGPPLPKLPDPTPGKKPAEFILVLPKEAPVSIVGSGIWFHGFGEFMEGDTLAGRRLFVGGLLINVDDETKKRIKGIIDDARKAVNELRQAGQTAQKPKDELRKRIKQRIDEERAKGADPKAMDELEKQMNGLVDGLPDTPDGIKAALADLDRRLAGLLDVFDAIEEFLKVTDDFIGERFFPVWHEDIDNEQKTGVEESKRVSAIARTMFIHPTPVINKHDEPMGWVEFIDSSRGTLGREPISAFFNIDPRNRATAGGLLDFVRANGGPIRLHLMAPPFTQAGSGNNLARRINPNDERVDYEFRVDLDVNGHPFPKRDDPPDLRP